jgi:hypothetical protein
MLKEECICPVCGFIDRYYLDKIDRIEFDHRICKCGYHFGYDDVYGINYKIWREEWLLYLLQEQKCEKKAIEKQLENLNILNIDNDNPNSIKKFKKISEQEQRRYVKRVLDKINISCPCGCHVPPS